MASAKEYAQKVYEDALALGIPEPQARLAAAQSSIETGYGKDAPGNAYFGIKAGSSWNGPTQNLTTHEEVNGKRVKITDAFRAYDSPAQSLVDWWSTLQRKWPDAATADNFNDAVKGLKAGKKGGYATATNYPSAAKYVNRNFLHPVPPMNIPDVGSELSVAALPKGAQNAARGVVPPPLPRPRPERELFKPLPSPTPLVAPNPVETRVASLDNYIPRQAGSITLPPPSTPLNPVLPPMPNAGHGTMQINPRSFTKSLPMQPAPVGGLSGSGAVQNSSAIAGPAYPLPPVARTTSAPAGSVLMASSRPSNIPIVPTTDLKLLAPQPLPVTGGSLAGAASRIGGGVATAGTGIAGSAALTRTPAPLPVIAPRIAPQVVARPPASIPLTQFNTVNPVSQIVPRIQSGFNTSPIGHVYQALTGQPVQGGLLSFLTQKAPVQQPQVAYQPQVGYNGTTQVTSDQLAGGNGSVFTTNTVLPDSLNSERWLTGYGSTSPTSSGKKK
jgi:hypothetical protein